LTLSIKGCIILLKPAPRSARQNVGLFCVALDLALTLPIAPGLFSHPVNNHDFDLPNLSNDSIASYPLYSITTVFLPHYDL
jgi:hypothetical protein